MSQDAFEPADIIIYVQGRGIVLKEKSLIAFRKTDDRIVAVGAKAEAMIGKDIENIAVMSPLRRGMVADYPEAVGLFSQLLIKALGKKPILRPAVAVCVPKGITSVEKKAIEEALMGAGAKEVWVANSPAEELIREFSEKFPKEYQKYKIVIGITKDNPERYVEERLRDALIYARQEHVPIESVYELLQEVQKSFG